VIFFGDNQMNRFYITLNGPEFEALLKSAMIDLREPKEQARFLLRSELERLGLFEPASEVSIGGELSGFRSSTCDRAQQLTNETGGN
jgi:hypothetical protein